MDAIACNWQFYFYHLVDDAGGYRRIIDAVDILRLLVQILVEVDDDRLGSVYAYSIGHAALVLIIKGRFGDNMDAYLLAVSSS